uniref:Uncharacterized protein n=1 Tax=Strombidium rassoulzadegani TaxID=1082188 RepID=A0A7S3CLA5_9SPIT|mmetsp:Transcript_15712/g.26492  ORF Transcript_15712/g.26492 Transcript_15712/m.26492 type:complete len:559 (+) Transcript_15712:59-1735(+)
MKEKGDKFTCLAFVKPDQLHHSVYLLIGLKSGYVWVTDTRVNQFLFNIKVLNQEEGGVQRIFSSHSRIIIEAGNNSHITCWDQSGKNGDKEYSQYNPFNLFMGRQEQLTIDGLFKSTFYDDTGNQIMALSTAGSIWYLNWVEKVTLKLKSCHNPTISICSADYKYVSPNEFAIAEEQDQYYTFNQNYQVATASSDGQIKLWNMHDLEYNQQFIVPKEQCTFIAMHQFKPFMICSYTDGFLRFFDLSTSKVLGRCQLFAPNDEKVPPRKFDVSAKDTEAVLDHVIQIKVLPSGNQLLAVTKNGQVVLIFVNSWSPLSIKIHLLVSIQTAINSFDFSYLEPYNKWLVATANGKVIVYNRKNFNSLSQEVFEEENPPQFDYMDSFNVQDYADNGFSQARRCNTLDHFYNMAQRNLVFNEVEPLHECEGLFVHNDLSLYLCFIRQCNQLFIRNFELHQVVKRIEISSTSLPKTMQLMPGGSSPFICIALQDNSIKLIDYVNEANYSSTETMHEQLTSVKVCPNGKYILSGGNRGDVYLWSVTKKILEPDAIRDAVKLDNNNL